VYRAVLLNKRYGISYTTYLHVYMLFAWMTAVLNLGLASALSSTMLRGATTQERVLAWTLAVITVAIVLAPFVVAPLLGRLRTGTTWQARALAKLEDLAAAIATHGRNPRLIGVVLVTGLFSFGMWIAFFRVALSGLGIEVGVGALALFLAIWQLSSLFIITPGNLGVQEIVYGVVCSAVGIGMAEGVVVSGLIRVIQYLVIFPLGLLCGGWGLVRRTGNSLAVQVGEDIGTTNGDLDQGKP
jgi:uncharacterized membrane protein YbhN (UPF0104 family)